MTLGWVNFRHWEPSEAIQNYAEELDCFVAIAPRNHDVTRPKIITH
jgi:hypothetical protein